MANAKGASKVTLTQRRQAAEAMMQGFLDSAVASDLSTALSNGYQPDKLVDSVVSEAPIGGVNR